MISTRRFHAARSRFHAARPFIRRKLAEIERLREALIRLRRGKGVGPVLARRIHARYFGKEK
jgi:hypothetical protein